MEHLKGVTRKYIDLIADKKLLEKLTLLKFSKAYCMKSIYISIKRFIRSLNQLFYRIAALSSAVV